MRWRRALAGVAPTQSADKAVRRKKNAFTIRPGRGVRKGFSPVYINEPVEIVTVVVIVSFDAFVSKIGLVLKMRNESRCATFKKSTDLGLWYYERGSTDNYGHG